MHATRAQRAYEPGMISQIVDPPDKLFDEARAPAEKVAKNSPSALIASKRALWESRETGLTAAMKAGGKHLMATSGRGAAVDVVQSLHYVGAWCLR